MNNATDTAALAIVNLTPHVINVHGGDSPVAIPPSGTVARATVTYSPAGSLPGGIPCRRAVYGDVTGLPAPVAGTVYIVSAIVRQAVADRTDVASPGELVRNAEGQPIGCDGLIFN